MTGETPFYQSAKRGKNLWQSYRVYPDRVELSCWALFSTFVIPADGIEEVSVLPPTLSPESLKNPRLAFRAGLKLDLSDFFTHVVLKRSRGLFSLLAFTPDDPHAFAAAVEKIKRTPAKNSSPVTPGR